MLFFFLLFNPHWYGWWKWKKAGSGCSAVLCTVCRSVRTWGLAWHWNQKTAHCIDAGLDLSNGYSPTGFLQSADFSTLNYSYQSLWIAITHTQMFLAQTRWVAALIIFCNHWSICCTVWLFACSVLTLNCTEVVAQASYNWLCRSLEVNSSINNISSPASSDKEEVHVKHYLYSKAGQHQISA